MKGLANLGNTCYLNAALQCLLYVPGLTNYVLQGWAEKDVSRKRINACALAAAYIQLVKDRWMPDGPAGPMDTTALLAALSKLHRPFATRCPHDAHEAAALVLKHLHDALGRTPRIRPSPAEGAVQREAWEANIAADGYSIVTELFCGQTECLVADQGGAYASTTHEHFVGLTLDLAACGSVDQALAKAFAPSTIQGYTLDSGAVVDVTQTKRLVYCPLVLVLHLKRFAEDGSKVDRFVDYSTTLAVPGHGTWDLFAACLHSDGHYRAACETRGQWYLLDDPSCTPLDMNAVITKEAYVLFYKKRL